ncbi:hypothetical protein HK405_012055 [Cladochytrium tenue]|nr:hypothetical protein HK405_012055 [Cladochytrium tenue]
MASLSSSSSSVARKAQPPPQAATRSSESPLLQQFLRDSPDAHPPLPPESIAMWGTTPVSSSSSTSASGSSSSTAAAAAAAVAAAAHRSSAIFAGRNHQHPHLQQQQPHLNHIQQHATSSALPDRYDDDDVQKQLDSLTALAQMHGLTLDPATLAALAMQQQQMQQLQQMNDSAANSRGPGASSTSATSRTAGSVKPELDLDPTDPFSFSADLGDLLLVDTPSSASQQQQQQLDLAAAAAASTPLALLSPLSASPLERDYFSQSLSSSLGVTLPTRMQHRSGGGSGIPDSPSALSAADLDSLRGAFGDTGGGSSDAFFAPGTPSSMTHVPSLTSLRPSLRAATSRNGSVGVGLAARRLSTTAAAATGATSTARKSARAQAAGAGGSANTPPLASPAAGSGAPPGSFFSMSLPATASGGAFASLDAANRLAFGSGGGGSSSAVGAATDAAQLATSLRPVATVPPHLLLQHQQQQRQRALSAASAAAASPLGGAGTPAAASMASSVSSSSASDRRRAAAAAAAGGGAVPPRRPGSVASVNMTDEPDTKLDRRRRRRESHNAVERRRRDNINEKIQELSSLLPDFGGDIQNKGSILRRSVEYIKMMQALASRQQERMGELEAVVAGLLARCGIAEADLALTVPLGTVFELPQISGVTAPGAVASPPPLLLPAGAPGQQQDLAAALMSPGFMAGADDLEDEDMLDA